MGNTGDKAQAQLYSRQLGISQMQGILKGNFSGIYFVKSVSWETTKKGGWGDRLQRLEEPNEMLHKGAKLVYILV